jgi:serine/threonine protein kinase/transcriptional regulator with XRE-family HTH domain
MEQDVPQNDLSDGPQVGDYSLLRFLGRGAAGRVYLGTPLVGKAFAQPGEPLAVKVYSPEILQHPNQDRRIQREFETETFLAHPRLVKAHDFSPEGPTPFLVMEWVDGVTLTEWLKMFHPVSGRLRLHLVTQLLEGLQYLHSNGLWHRDLKPSNIMVLPTFDVKIMDLGVVHVEEDVSLTPEGERLGTRRNSSPELLRGDEHDQRTDLYSLGTVVYALLHGEEVFADAVGGELEELVRSEMPTFEDELFSQDLVSKVLCDVAKELLQKDPDLRLTFAEDVIARLETATDNLLQDGGFEPLSGYVGTALTGLSEDERDAIHFTSHTVARVAKERELYVYQPRKASDPILHPQLSPEVVYQMDRKRVAESDVFFVLANKPSFGVGQELEIAAAYGKPAFFISREGITMSRMMRGSLVNLVGDIVYAGPDDLEQKLSKSLGQAIPGLRAMKRRDRSRSHHAGELGQRVRRARVDAGYETADELAGKLNIPVRILNAIERGEYDTIGAPYLEQIAATLRLPLSQLFADEYVPEPHHEDPNLRRLEALVRERGLDMSARDFLELRDEYQMQPAAHGEFADISKEGWLKRHEARQLRQLREAEQQDLFT